MAAEAGARLNGAAFVFNAARLIAFLGPLTAGAISRLGSYGIRDTTVALLSVLGLVVAPSCPEAEGQALPE